MSLTIASLKTIFDKHLPKETLEILSYDNDGEYSVVNSDDKWYDFDKSEGFQNLMTADSANIIGDKLIFAEFKNEKIKSGTKLKFLRLKANESLISLLLLIRKENTAYKIEDLVNIQKECFFVFSKHKTTPTELLAFNATHRIMQKYYEGTLFTKFIFMDCEQFKGRFC